MQFDTDALLPPGGGAQRQHTVPSRSTYLEAPAATAKLGFLQRRVAQVHHIQARGHPRPVPHPAADILQHAGALRRLGTLFFVLAVFGRPVISRSRPHAVNILGRFNLPAPLLNRQGRAPLHGLQDDTVRLLRESRLQQLLSLIIYIYTTDTTNYINSTRPDGIH